MSDHEWPAVLFTALLTWVNQTMNCNSAPKEPLAQCGMLAEAHLLNEGMSPLLTQSLDSFSVKPVIVFGLITYAHSATPSLGWHNGPSVLCLDKVGTLEVCQIVMHVSLFKEDADYLAVWHGEIRMQLVTS